MDQKRLQQSKFGAGFTILELLVVLAIISLLSSLALAVFSTARTQARDSRRIVDLKQLQNALELYYNDHRSYPQPSQGWGNWSGHCDNYGNSDNYIVGLAPNYIPALPRDPSFDFESQCYIYNSLGAEYMILAAYTMETVGANTADASNPSHIRAMARPCTLNGNCFPQPSIAIYTPEAEDW